ncbi:MAG: carboxypeptidase-like regulatory domain-containing protein, partial [Bacteroidia bacterium]
MQKLFFLLLGFLFLISETTFAQEGKIYGVVKNQNGEIQPYAVVSLIQRDTILHRVYADSNGNYVLPRVYMGKYDLKVQIAEKQLFITGVEMNMGEIRQLDATWSSPCFEPIREDFGFKR